MTHQSSDLLSAIDHLYDVFQSYPLRPHVEGCTHCVHPEDHIRLGSKPLRKLIGEDLSRYARKAMTTWGDDHDFRHFLPRILELVATEDASWVAVDTQVIFSKLEYGKWLTWPDREQGAVHTYLMALFNHILTRPLSEVDTSTTNSLDPYLCAIGQGVDDLYPFLSRMNAANTEPSLYRIGHFVDANLPYLINSTQLMNAYWKGRKPQMQQVILWMLAAENETLINNALMLYVAKEEYTGFESVSQYIEIIRQLRASQPI
jgi:hypothetical protein